MVDGISAAAADTDDFDPRARDRWLVYKHFNSVIFHLKSVRSYFIESLFRKLRLKIWSRY